MHVYVQQIKPEGIDLDQTYSAKSIGLTSEDNAWFITPIAIKAQAYRAEDAIILKAMAKSRYESICGCCLEEVKQDWAAEFTLIFDIEKQSEFIVMDEDIRQELILNLPVRIVCRDDCQGLCIECGVNLNIESCACRLSGQKSVVSGQPAKK